MAKERKDEQLNQPDTSEVDQAVQPESSGVEPDTSPPDAKATKGKAGRKGRDPGSGSGKTKGVDKHYRRMELQSKFWNKVDPLNKFRHWYLGAASVTRSLFRVAAAWQTILVLGTAMVILYVMSAFYTGKGEFVVKVDRPMANEGFLISETPDFEQQLVTLRNDAVDDATNISLDEIPREVKDIDGKHNGSNYVAYTFYLKNCTGEDKDYQMELTLNSSSKHVEKASWIMIYKNGKQKIYAQENEDGYPECMYRRWEIPFSEDAQNPGYMNSTVTDPSTVHVPEEVAEMHELDDFRGVYQLKTYPWESSDMVCTETRTGMHNEEVDKYTIVIWLEGDDPDCTDELFGGHIELRMLFTY